MLDKKLPLSVVLVSYNEEENIGRTLESIYKIASEIVLVDSFSTDKTVEIAKRYGARIFLEEWKGYINQKNSALEKCTQPWILALDCDEVPTDELLMEISNAVLKNEKIGYFIQRKTYYLGKLLKRSWQPDWKLRLVPKDTNPRWSGIEPHDRLIIDAETTKLGGYLVHYSYKDVLHHFQKTVKYAKISAGAYHKMGKRASIFKIIFSPIIAFIKGYFINMGFVDGMQGLIAAMSAGLSAFLKYIFLWEVENSRSGRDE